MILAVPLPMNEHPDMQSQEKVMMVQWFNGAENCALRKRSRGWTGCLQSFHTNSNQEKEGREETVIGTVGFNFCGGHSCKGSAEPMVI